MPKSAVFFLYKYIYIFFFSKTYFYYYYVLCLYIYIYISVSAQLAWNLNPGDTKKNTRYYIHILTMENQLRTFPSEPIKPCHAGEMRQLLCPLRSHVHAISRPPAAPVLFALSSSAVGLTGLFVLISIIFAKELTSEDRSPYVLSCDTERTRPSGGLGVRARMYAFNTYFLPYFHGFGSPCVEG